MRERQEDVIENVSLILISLSIFHTSIIKKYLGFLILVNSNFYPCDKAGLLQYFEIRNKSIVKAFVVNQTYFFEKRLN